MSQSRAWKKQADSDFVCMEIISGETRPDMRCQVIAKSQQCVEKTIKALVSSLSEIGVQHTTVGYDHSVIKFISVLIRASQQPAGRMIYSHISIMLSGKIQSDIYFLERLIPKRPSPGAPPSINTEYPFQGAAGNWSAPADEEIFRDKDVRRYRELAHHIHLHGGRIWSTLQRSKAAN